MLRFTKTTASKKAGLSPGTLVHVGDKKTEYTKITLTNYGPETYGEEVLPDIGSFRPITDEPTVTWINIDGLHDMDLIEKVGLQFAIHPLVLEDIVHTEQRSKMEDFEDYLFIVFKMLFFDKSEDVVKSEQISLILGDRFIISFQEIEGDVFNPVRERIRRGKGRIRKMGCDYLAYTLIDATVDQYFTILETLGERIEELEDELQENKTYDTSIRIHSLKREMIYLRKQIWPMRDMVAALQKSESVVISENIGVYLADIYDHTVQIIDTIESFRDILSGLLDIYLSLISKRTNDVMKVLTVIATLFIPLTFLVGVYGMNFEYMPELEWRWGYYAVWGFMLFVSISMIIFFKRKKWI